MSEQTRAHENARRDPAAIDLNADAGEADTPERRAAEDAVLASVTSVNIACGGHAGDTESMRHAVRAAARLGLAAGVHPSFPDRANFGRARMDLDAQTLRAEIARQIAALAEIAHAEGVALTHCKPHGALYHAASADESVARAVYLACQEIDPALRLVGQAGSRAVERWLGWGAQVAREAFADRVYESDGSLRSRRKPGAVITDPSEAARQAVAIAKTGRVRCADGTMLGLAADTLCVHADTPDAASIASRIAASLSEARVIVGPLR